MGIAMDMNYCGDSNGSSPSAPDYLFTLQKYFKYYVLTKNSTIKNELDQNRPVYISLRGEPTGHAAVVDGYDADGWYHINFGWGGSYNGYFPLYNGLNFGVGYTLNTNVTPAYISREPTYVNQADSLILVSLHNAFKGSMGWDLNTPVHGWEYVDILNGRVVGLNIRNEDYKVKCAIPDEISKLTELRELTVFAYLTGDLTSEITKLHKLQSLTVFNLNYYDNNHDFSFRLTPEIGNWTDLEYLQIDNPQGAIPAAIGNLKNLKKLSLSRGNLSGVLPQEIGNLTRLTSLDLSNNQLSGIIPASLGTLSKLETLYLYNNQFNAVEDGEWNCPKMIRMSLSNNQIEGTLPELFLSDCYLTP